jgi:hypothetical protein
VQATFSAMPMHPPSTHNLDLQTRTQSATCCRSLCRLPGPARMCAVGGVPLGSVRDVQLPRVP